MHGLGRIRLRDNPNYKNQKGGERVKRHHLGILAIALAIVLSSIASPALAAPATKGMLYHNGNIVGTVVVSAPLPKGGQDPFYMVTNGVTGQLGIAGVAPGDGPYHGGAWAIYTVTFNVAPYLLTSDEDVMAAEAAGDVTVTRNRAADFRCPVLPRK